MPADQREQFDTPWKIALTRYFQASLAFFFRSLHAAVDWTRPIRFHDKELANHFASDHPEGRVADLIASVHLKGRASPVMLHIEVQAQRDDTLPQRMLDYNYLIRRTFQRPVASMAILADSDAAWMPPPFIEALPGSVLSLTYATAKVSDHAHRLDALLKDRNPFALVTAAQLLAHQTHGVPELRYAWKWRLTRLLYDRGWDKRRIMDLFILINWLLLLPVELERRLWQNIRRLERRRNMRWISPLEQTFIDKGFKQGLERGLKTGIEKGMEKGQRDGAARLLEELLASRFGPLPRTTQQRLAKADMRQLLAWTNAALEAETLRQVFNR